MSNDIAKSGRLDLLSSTSSFVGWNDEVAGDDKPENAGLIQGVLLKFSGEGRWVTRDGTEVDVEELIATGVVRVVQRWEGQRPIETIVLEPGEPFPDLDELNNAVPRDQWEDDLNGNPRGPYQAQHILYLLDFSTMEKFTFPTGTFGGRAAIRELRDKLVWMQRLRGANVYPVVTLADIFMKTRYGGRQRPFFKIVRWVRLGGDGHGDAEVLPGPTSPITSPAAATAVPLSEVEEPTLSEELDDAIPDFDAPSAEPVKTPPPHSTARREPAAKPAAKKPAAKNGNARRRVNARF